MDLCLQVIINKFEAPGGTAETCSVSDVFFFFLISLSSHWIRPTSCLMDLCLLEFVNDLEAPGQWALPV
jgi:hypothetical protein